MANNPTVLLLNKEANQTSFSFLGPIKKLIDPKVGHTGTLDRFATGLMIVLTGPLTKLNTLFSNLDKTYLATIRFGSETDTLDPEGEVIATAPIPQIKTIEKILKENFSGVISQQPPQYSAIHVKGERAYRLARQGQRFSMPNREVEIFDTQILNYNKGDLKIRIHCSKGTYIRAIARDLGELCGSKGHLAKLQRIAIGPYCIEESVGADDYPNLRNQRDKPHDIKDSSDIIRQSLL
jgi:tRNA pseudouridine55 synthase